MDEQVAEDAKNELLVLCLKYVQLSQKGKAAMEMDVLLHKACCRMYQPSLTLCVACVPRTKPFCLWLFSFMNLQRKKTKWLIF